MKRKNKFLVYPLAVILVSMFIIVGCDDDDIINDNLPVITTLEVADIEPTTATSGGNITDDSGATVTARGVIWSKDADLTINDNEGITVDGAGAGSFTSNITGLEPETQYYVRAYATNSNGTGYGNALAFTTLEEVGNLPALTTTEITSITQTSANSGGNITDDGGTTVTARGVIWSTSANLTVNNNEGITVDGAGAGSFTSNITELEPETQYYVRAYATNSNGTGYGNALAFTTLEETTGTVTDIDGNVYQTVIIGDQEWMAENLRVTRYNNEDEIPTGLSNAAWSNTTSGAYAIYNNDDNMLQAYGKLYNWYAVNNPNGLCPEGWYVPSDEQWKMLEGHADSKYAYPHPIWDMKGFRGFDAGLNLKTVHGWNDAGGGTNIIGFSGLPGGRRNSDGNYDYIGNSGYWWTSTEEDSSAIRRSLYSSSMLSNRFDRNKADGRSVRCIKNLD